MNDQAKCDVCGKPCGSVLDGAKVSHLQCAFEAAKGPRDRLWNLMNSPIANRVPSGSRWLPAMYLAQNVSQH